MDLLEGWLYPRGTSTLDIEQTRPILGAFGMRGMAPFSKEGKDSPTPLNIHKKSNIYQTFINGKYAFIPLLHTSIPPGTLHWRWRQIKKQRAQKARSSAYRNEVKIPFHSNHHTRLGHIRDEYGLNALEPHTGSFLDLEA